MITRHSHKHSPVTAVRVTSDPLETAKNREDVAKLTDERAVPGSQRNDSFIVETPTGRVMAGPGDWIIRHENGDLAVVSDTVFGEDYETGETVE